MRKKILSTIFLIGFLLIFYTGISSAESYAATTQDLGYYDCWLHADGKTWQKGIQPGSTVSPTFTIQTPIDTSKVLKSYNVSFLSDTQGKFTNKYYQYAVDNGNITNYKYLGNSKMQYTIQTTLRAHEIINGLDITKSDQSELVQGRRFYLPVLISWEYENDSVGGGGGCYAIGYKGVYHVEVDSSRTNVYWYLGYPKTLIEKWTYSKTKGWQQTVYYTAEELEKKYPNDVEFYSTYGGPPQWIPKL